MTERQIIRVQVRKFEDIDIGRRARLVVDFIVTVAGSVDISIRSAISSQIVVPQTAEQDIIVCRRTNGVVAGRSPIPCSISNVRTIPRRSIRERDLLNTERPKELVFDLQRLAARTDLNQKVIIAVAENDIGRIDARKLDEVRAQIVVGL